MVTESPNNGNREQDMRQLDNPSIKELSTEIAELVNQSGTRVTRPSRGGCAGRRQTGYPERR